MSSIKKNVKKKTFPILEAEKMLLWPRHRIARAQRCLRATHRSIPFASLRVRHEVRSLMVRGCRQGGADPSDYLSWSASYILLVGSNGRGDDPRDHGGRGTQDYEPSCSLRPPFPTTHAVSGRPHSRNALR